MRWNSVVESEDYLADAERLLSEEERIAVVDAVAKNPTLGVIIKSTGGLRKMRVGVGNRGKRGGGRVIYWFHSPGFPVVLLSVFAKNEASDLSAKERTALGRLASGLMEDFRRS
jgi:hypothetical protein